MSRLNSEEACRQAAEMSREGNYPQALMLLRLALSKNPDDPRLQQALQETLERSERAPKSTKKSSHTPNLQLDDALEWEQQRLAEIRGEKSFFKNGKIIAIAAAMLLVALTAGAAFWFYTRDTGPSEEAATAAYQACAKVLPLTRNLTIHGKTILRLRAQKARIFKMKRKLLGKKLRHALEEAKKQGFSEIALYDDKNRKIVGMTDDGHFVLIKNRKRMKIPEETTALEARPPER